MSASTPLNLAVLISGNGSNLQAIIDAIAKNHLPAQISVVISNKAEAGGLKLADRAGIPTVVLPHQDFASRQKYDEALQTCLDNYHPQLIILAGFMRILGEEFIRHFPNRIVNIHPSLLPKYPGLHTHQQVLTAGDHLHGVTVHVVTEQLDAGAIIAQACIPVTTQDDVASLTHKVHKLEHQLYPEVIKLYAEKRLQLMNNGVFLDGVKLPANGLQLAVTE